MPTSKKRVKKEKNILAEPVYKNPLKSRWGKVTVLVLAIAFVAGLILTTAIIMWQVVFG